MICKQVTDPDRFELVCDWCLTAGPSAGTRESARVLALEAGYRVPVLVTSWSAPADLCPSCRAGSSAVTA